MPIPVMKGYASLKTLPEEKIGDKISRKILVGEKEMVVFWKMKAGARAPSTWLNRSRMVLAWSKARTLPDAGDGRRGSTAVGLGGAAG